VNKEALAHWGVVAPKKKRPTNIKDITALKIRDFFSAYIQILST